MAVHCSPKTGGPNDQIQMQKCTPNGPWAPWPKGGQIRKKWPRLAKCLIMAFCTCNGSVTGP